MLYTSFNVSQVILFFKQQLFFSFLLFLCANVLMDKLKGSCRTPSNDVYCMCYDQKSKSNNGRMVQSETFLFNKHDKM